MYKSILVLIVMVWLSGCSLAADAVPQDSLNKMKEKCEQDDIHSCQNLLIIYMAKDNDHLTKYYAGRSCELGSKEHCELAE